MGIMGFEMMCQRYLEQDDLVEEGVQMMAANETVLP